MTSSMDYASLRHLSPRELALRFRHASQEQSARTLSTQLLKAIELQTLPPTVYDGFLTSVESPCPLKDALWQSHSKHIRCSAIRRFGKDLKSLDWENTWREVGGKEGLLDLFSQRSVLEVKELCKVIGRCPQQSAVENGLERQRRVTELVKCLMGTPHPSTPSKSRDQRPLHRLYAQMVPACTSDFVISLLLQQFHPLQESIPSKRLVQNHFQLLRRLIFDAISEENSFNGAATDRVLNFIPQLLRSAHSIPVVEPRFSASMSLAVSILEKITADEVIRFPERIFMPILMVPLIRRLQAHRVDQNRVLQIVQLAVKYLQSNEHARTHLSLVKGKLICYVANYWSRAAPLFKGCLVDLIGLFRGGSQRDLSYYQDLIHQVARPQRYDLLRIICLHSKDIQVDIESDDGLKTIPVEIWPVFMFQMLQRDHSITFLQRLLRLNPEADFLEPRFDRTIFSHPRSPYSGRGDPRLLLTILQSRNEGAEHVAQRQVSETLRSKASKSREQTDRAFFATSAVFYAIASGSLDLYGDVVRWIRRFSRDAMTVKKLYSPDVTCTVEGIALLGGIPEDLDPWNVPDIRTRTTKARSIMLSLLETAVMSLREPSFYALDWIGPLTIFRDVVMSRMSNAGRLKSHFQLSEDELYDILWSGTIEMLLQVEELGLKNEALGFNSPHGPLSFRCNPGFVSQPALPSSYRFLDNLARSRDALWKRFRPTMDPAVAALELPWPLGLPIQCVMGPFNVAVDSAFAQTPFMANRAAEIVMTDPANVLVDVTNSKEARHAIGQFIDSFDTALAIYVMQCPPGYERDSRVHAAWSHATNALSHGPSATQFHAANITPHGRLSENEAEPFWRAVFKNAIPQVKIPDPEMEVHGYPVIPTDVDPREPFEWHPAASIPPGLESRELRVTILDCMIAAPRWLQWKTKHDFRVPKPKTQAIAAASMWSPERLKAIQKIPRAVQEGMIATALLVESSKIEGSSRILASPFPSEINVRFPSLFLDHDFLLSNDALQPSADIALSHFIKMVPSTLLRDLTVSALDALSRTPSGSAKLASTERTAYRFLMLLSKSDRAQLASTLLIRTVLDRPDSSSWHRQLLRKTFFRSLLAEEAETMILLFASSILEKLEHQVTSSRKQQKAEGSGTSPDRYIKVTTVKFLAQILDDADFIPPDFCVDILSKLFQSASHVDIRVAVLDSMLSRLGRCADDSSNALAERLMSALEEAIPSLASLNERKQMQQADWTEAEETGILPEVYDDGGRQVFGPMLSAMLLAIGNHSMFSDTLRTGLIRRIALPVVEKSKEESARWVKLFTLKHLPAGHTIHTPSVPVRPGFLGSLIKTCSSEVPKYVLEDYLQFFLTNISPSAELTKLNDKVNGDIELRNSNEGQFWLSLYGKGANIFSGTIVSMLTEPWKPSVVPDGLQIPHVQETVFQMADALLQLPDESFHHWNSFMEALGPPVAQYRNEQDRKAWLAAGKPVVLRIIKRIDTLRTSAWQRDRNRQPAVLPPTFSLRLWLLDYPQLENTSEATEKCAIFAQQLISALREILALGPAHHAKLNDVESAASRCLPEDDIRVACCLGTIDPSDPTKAQETSLRAELADALLRKATLPRNKDDAMLQSIKAVLETWRECELEDVRMRGIRLGKHLKM